MKVFGWEVSVSKKLPAGAVSGGSLVDEANRQSGKTGQLGLTASPATGAAPDPGPVPTLTEREESARRPIRWQFPYATNQIWTPRRNLTPFAIMRQIADIDDISRICIETRKDQICSLGWDIVPKDPKQNATLNGKREDIKGFFGKPDRRRAFSTWLRMAIEDILVVDALSIYRRRTRGGQLYALELKDGATFLPLLDTDGDIPLAPSVAYRQIIYGQPVEGGDCTVDDLYYRPRTVRTHTPYGLSPVEAILLTVNAALNREVFNLQYYTEGNIPEGLLEAPKGFTTKQLIEFQDYLDDYLSGDLAKRRRIKVVHEGGSKVFQFKEPDFATVYDEWLLKVRCAAFAVPPQEIGFTADVNKATGDNQENVVYRRGVKPMTLFLKELFDEIIAIDLKSPDLQWIWTGGEPEDKKLQAEVDAIYLEHAVVSVDDVRGRLGMESIGVGPAFMTPMGPVFVEELLAREPDDDPDTSEVDTPPAAGEKPKKDEGAAGAVNEAVLAELRKWRAVAVKCVKARKPIRAFTSDVIPFELHVRVEAFLKHAEKTGNLGQVVAAFDFAVADYEKVQKLGAEARVLTKAENRAAKAYQRLMSGHFKKQGAALVAHIKKGLDDAAE